MIASWAYNFIYSIVCVKPTSTVTLGCIRWTASRRESLTITRTLFFLCTLIFKIREQLENIMDDRIKRVILNLYYLFFFFNSFHFTRWRYNLFSLLASRVHVDDKNFFFTRRSVLFPYKRKKTVDFHVRSISRVNHKFAYMCIY